MLSHYTKICPSCGRAFECRVDDIEQCQCYGIQLKPETQLAIREKFSTCLCSKCLMEIDEQVMEGESKL
jgi:hypothetical protein